MERTTGVRRARGRACGLWKELQGAGRPPGSAGFLAGLVPPAGAALRVQVWPAVTGKRTRTGEPAPVLQHSLGLGVLPAVGRPSTLPHAREGIAATTPDTARRSV